MRETSKQPPPRVPSADFASPRSHEISLEELMMIDLKAWIAAKDAIRRASDPGGRPAPIRRPAW